MKMNFNKLKKTSAFLLFLFFGLNFLNAEESDILKTEQQDSTKKETEINPRTGFPEITKKPFVMFNEGFSFAQVTRIEKMENRSNFVRENYLAGLYFGIQTENMMPVNSMIRISAFYPVYNTFNGMQQFSKQTILYAFDLFAGPMIQTDMWKYIRLNFAGGLHYMYQLTDEYHMHYLGLGALAGCELPVAKRWTILLNGLFTLDYPNFGTNRLVQPFSYAWQYHLELGLRYSKRGENKYSYIRSRK